jgi:1-acyl-sn-glycerol-3-phosphate acyltransferase
MLAVKFARLVSSLVLLCAVITPAAVQSFGPSYRTSVAPVGFGIGQHRRTISSHLGVSQGITENITPNGAAEAVTLSPPTTARSAPPPSLSKWKASLTKLGMMGFVLSMCLALPLTLLPQQAAYKLGLMDRLQKEKNAVWTGQFCARWMLRLFPFMRLQTFPYHDPDPPPSIWVSNHCSLLDVFILLAVDKRLRGPFRRPIKIVYWKQLEDNPVTKLLFRQAGFIPIQMAANKAGEDNDYDKSSFRQLLKDTKRAFEEGFDIGILPEGQLNPDPEAGLLPVFSGAFTLARMSRRPVQMIAMHGAHNLWHPIDGMSVKGRHVKARVYPTPFRFTKAADFIDSFKAIVGSFATTGQDLPRDDLDAWLNGDKLRENQVD